MSKWRRTWGGPGFQRTLRLSNGQKLRMEFTYPRDDHETFVNVGMVCYRGLYVHRWSWRKQGVPIGPGGLEVLPLALQAIQDAEDEMLRRIKTQYVTIKVYAATEKLFRIYERVLLTRGYESHYDWDSNEALLFKYLR